MLNLNNPPQFSMLPPESESVDVVPLALSMEDKCVL